jgi:hypothetical protein
MNYIKDVYPKLGAPDISGIDQLNFTKSYELLYDIDNSQNINLLILSVNKLPILESEYDKVTIKAMFIVYDDKRIEEYKL